MSYGKGTTINEKLIIVNRELNSIFDSVNRIILPLNNLIYYTMKRFSGLFMVSLLSGAMTLGAYKLLFEENGPLSANSKSVVTVAPNN